MDPGQNLCRLVLFFADREPGCHLAFLITNSKRVITEHQIDGGNGAVVGKGLLLVE